MLRGSTSVWGYRTLTSDPRQMSGARRESRIMNPQFRIPNPQSPIPNPFPKSYSYLSASIGSRRDALNAGYIPKKMPTDAEKPRPIANDHHGSEIGKPDNRCTAQPTPLPSRMPSSPPSEVRNAASIRN